MDDLNIVLKVLMKDTTFRKAYDIETNKKCNCKFTKRLIDYNDKKLCNHCGYIVVENKEKINVKLVVESLHQHGLVVDFVDGYFNSCHEELDKAVKVYQHELLNMLDKQITDDIINAEVAGNFLQYFGEIEDDNTYNLRLSILVKQLSHKSACVRDGAGLGIANMDYNLSIKNISVINELILQISKEKIHDLREDLQLVLDQILENNICECKIVTNATKYNHKLKCKLCGNYLDKYMSYIMQKIWDMNFKLYVSYSIERLNKTYNNITIYLNGNILYTFINDINNNTIDAHLSKLYEYCNI